MRFALARSDKGLTSEWAFLSVFILLVTELIVHTVSELQFDSWEQCVMIKP